MGRIRIYLQGEDIIGIHRIRVRANCSIREFKMMAAKARRAHVDDELLLFRENVSVPLREPMSLPQSQDGLLRLHLHRCRHVHVTVNYRGHTCSAYFAPGTTFDYIHKWVAREKLTTGNYRLRIAGTQTLPLGEQHLGTFVEHPFCQLALDIHI